MCLAIATRRNRKRWEAWWRWRWRWRLTMAAEQYRAGYQVDCSMRSGWQWYERMMRCDSGRVLVPWMVMMRLLSILRLLWLLGLMSMSMPTKMLAGVMVSAVARIAPAQSAAHHQRCHQCDATDADNPQDDRPWQRMNIGESMKAVICIVVVGGVTPIELIRRHSRRGPALYPTHYARLSGVVPLRVSTAAICRSDLRVIKRSPGGLEGRDALTTRAEKMLEAARVWAGRQRSCPHRP